MTNSIVVDLTAHISSRSPQPVRHPRDISAIRHRLVIAAGADSYAVAARLDVGRHALVLLGATESKNLRRLRQTYPELPILIDRAPYNDADATAEAPFPVGNPETALLAPPSIDDLIAAQVEEGATLAVLAMGYLAPGDPEPLRVAIAKVKAATRRDAVLLVPADAAWLNATYIAQFIAILKTCPVPVAVGFNHQGNALKDAACLHGFRLLFEQVPDAIAWRVDHNGLGAMAHGAAAAVIGVLPSHRHVSVRGDVSRSPKDKHPHVWVPELMLWGKASELRRSHFATTEAPGCTASPCLGKSPIRFSDSESDIHEGHLHNIEAFLEEHRLMPADRDEAKAWWRTRVRDAVASMAAFGVRAQRPRLKPPADVHNWFKELK